MKTFTANSFFKLFLIIISFSGTLYAQSSLESDTIVKDKLIISVNDTSARTLKKSLLQRLRLAIQESDLNEKVTEIKPLFSPFCSLSRTSQLSPEALHLALLNQGLANLLQLDNGRDELLKAYLKAPATDLCNHFVITIHGIGPRKLASYLTSKRIAGIDIRDIQLVHRYTINKSRISNLTTSKLRPKVAAGVITTRELNKSFFGLRWNNKGETAFDNIDNERNAYVDDIFGIRSNEADSESSDSVSGGFVTISVAHDQGESIRYTTIEAANALLYAFHTGLEKTFLPYGEDDTAVKELAEIGRRIGSYIFQTQDDFDPFNNRLTRQVNFGSPSSETGVGFLISGEFGSCTASEIIKKRCILTAGHCVKSFAATSDLFYSQESVIHNESQGVKIVRSARMPVIQHDYPEGSGEIATDIGVYYASNDRYKLLTSSPTCSGHSCGYFWSPRQLGTANENDIVKIAGYSSQDLPETTGLYYKKREGQFKIKEIDNAVLDGNLYQVLTMRPLGSGRLNKGDSGAPVLKNNTQVGVQSSIDIDPDRRKNAPAKIGYAAGMSFFQRTWIKEQAQRLCRLTGGILVAIKPEVDGFTTTMTSKDPQNDPDFMTTRTCDTPYCSQAFIKLHVDIDPPPGLVFDHYENHPRSPDKPCLCPARDISCPIDISVYSDVLENSPGTIQTSCLAIFVTPSPTPTATSTVTVTPTKTPTSTPSPTRSPTATPTRTSTPAPTATQTETPTATPSATQTPTSSATPTKTRTPISSATPTRTRTPISSPTPTKTSTPITFVTTVATATPPSSSSAIPSSAPVTQASATPTNAAAPTAGPASN